MMHGLCTDDARMMHGWCTDDACISDAGFFSVGRTDGQGDSRSWTYLAGYIAIGYITGKNVLYGHGCKATPNSAI